jgi:hypothetical protein
MGDREGPTQLSQNCQDEKHEDCPGYEWTQDNIAVYCFCDCHRAGRALPVDRPR